MLISRLHNKPPEPIANEEPWKALPGSQADALGFDVNHILYHGTRGPGKTDTQLMRFKRRVGLGYGPFWRGVIFDREYKNLDDIISKSKRWFNLYDDGAKFLEGNSALKWVWPTGEELLFRVAKEPRDYWKYHGQEFPFIGWNELCKYPSDELYEMMMSCNRSSYTPDKDGYIGGAKSKQDNVPKGWNPDGSYGVPPEIPLEVFNTTNPYGPGHNWVKRRFITAAEPGEIVSVTTEVYNPRTKQKEPTTRTQTHLFGSYRENPYLSPQYIATIANLKDKNKRKAWLGGSWDIVAGGAIDDVWDRTKHVVPRFAIPKGWYVDRAFDWGSSHPAAAGWFALANGEEVELPDGSKFCPRPGSLIMFDELYVSAGIGTNTGLRWSATKVAQAIKEKEIAALALGYVFTTPWPGPADNQIHNVNDSGTETIAKKMADENIHWEPSDKAKGSRKQGLQLVRDRLEAVIDGDDKPGLYFMENCRATIDLLPTLPRDELDMDDVDTASEDHLYDVVRYRCLKGSDRLATTLKVNFAT